MEAADAGRIWMTLLRSGRRKCGCETETGAKYVAARKWVQRQAGTAKARDGVSRAPALTYCDRRYAVDLSGSARPRHSRASEIWSTLRTSPACAKAGSSYRLLNPLSAAVTTRSHS